MKTSADYVQSRDYEERVYAGVLGKIIGVYLGRPFEGWTNERIERELGEVDYYVHEKLGVPLVVTDDDISGTFTFVRALAENGYNPNLTPAQIGDWWRNVIIENKTILWWGGLGMSTEHTAFLRLKAGVKAPESGSIGTNGAIVAEQIGAQIFIDGWGLICPGDPERAVEFARRAASVSHDGAAVHAAQIVAALVSQAFVERDWDVLLDAAVSFVPRDGVVYKLASDVRAWASQNGDDWRATFRQIQSNYGYDKFGGACHVVPNHAVVLMAILHGNGDFGRALMIANTAGWDTDCNAGNVGCVMGVWGGLAAIDAGPDWRGPVADRLFLPTADGGRGVSDAVRETFFLVNSARALSDLPPSFPKNGARFHFSLPGSVQGFRGENVTLSNVSDALSLRFDAVTHARAVTDTFVTPETAGMSGYELVASPTLYAGQLITASLSAPALSSPVSLCLFVESFGGDLTILRGPSVSLSSDSSADLTFRVPETNGLPIARVGLEMTAKNGVSGEIRLEKLTWNGTPTVTLGGKTETARRAWVNAADHFDGRRVIQNAGTGLVTQGEWEWTNYAVTTEIVPHLARRIGLVVAIRGLRRYIALVLDADKRIRLIEQNDDTQRVLAEFDATWEFEKTVTLSITLTSGKITAQIDDETRTATGENLPTRGAIGMLVETGHAEFGELRVTVSPRIEMHG